MGNEASTAEGAEGGSTEAPTAAKNSNEANGRILGAPTTEVGSTARAKAVAEAVAEAYASSEA